MFSKFIYPSKIVVGTFNGESNKLHSSTLYVHELEISEDGRLFIGIELSTISGGVSSLTATSTLNKKEVEKLIVTLQKVIGDHNT